MFGPEVSGPPARRASARLGLVLLLVAALAMPGCFGGHGESSDVKEIIDVRDLPQVDTSQDPQAEARKPSLVGILPSDFPSDLPLYLPASLVDFGANPRSVDLLSPDAPGRVRPELFRLIRGSGWIVQESGGSASLSKGSRQVRLIVREEQPGTLYRFEY